MEMLMTWLDGFWGWEWNVFLLGFVCLSGSGKRGWVLDPFHCRNRTLVLFPQCMRSTGDTELGSPEPDEFYCCPFSITTAGRPAKGLVDRAHREDVDRPRLGQPGSLCRGSTGQGPGWSGQLWRPIFMGSVYLLWRTLSGTLVTLFGLIWLYVRKFWADVLHGYFGCIRYYSYSFLNGTGQRGTLFYIYARRLFVRVSRTLFLSLTE